MTAWNDGGVVSLHWQGKFRGAAWEPMQLELVGHTTSKLMDSKKRCIPTVVANEVTVTRAIDLSVQNEGRENRALELILANPNLSDRGLADALGIGKTAANAIKKDLIARKWIVARARKHFLADEGKRGSRAMKRAGKTGGHARSTCPPSARCGQTAGKGGQRRKYIISPMSCASSRSGQTAGKIERILPLPAPSLTLVGRAEGKRANGDRVHGIQSWTTKERA